MPTHTTRVERRRRKWEISTSKLAEATGLKPRAIRKDINAGVVDPNDLYAVAIYILERAPRREFGKRPALPYPQKQQTIQKEKVVKKVKAVEPVPVKKVRGVYL